MSIKNILLACTVLLLAACAMPSTQVKSGSERPSLMIMGAPENSTLYVDGLFMGSAAQQDQRAKRYAIEDGVHHIQIKQGDTVLHAEKIFASNGEMSTVVVKSGGQ